MKKLLYLSLILLIVACSGGVTPKGEYRLGSSYSYFSSNGNVSFYKSDGVKYCNTKGKWKIDGKIIYVSNLYNPNCPEMSSYNGKYLIEESRLVRSR